MNESPNAHGDEMYVLICQKQFDELKEVIKDNGIKNADHFKRLYDKLGKLETATTAIMTWKEEHTKWSEDVVKRGFKEMEDFKEDVEKTTNEIKDKACKDSKDLSKRVLKVENWKLKVAGGLVVLTVLLSFVSSLLFANCG